MDRKKYLTILTVVTVVCILAGLYIHVVSFAIPLFGTNKGSGKTVTDTVDITGVNDIDLDLDVFNVDISAGDSYSLSYSCPEAVKPEITTDDKGLHVKSRKNNHFFSPFNLGSLKSDCKMTITVPAGSSLNELSADVDLGNLNVNDLEIIEAELGADTGNINAVGLKTGSVSIDTDAGNVYLGDSTANTLNINTDAGNVRIDKVSAAQADVSSDVGNLDISGDFEILNGESDVGNINYDPADDSKEGRAVLITDVGNVRVNGESRGKKYMN